MLVSIPVLVLVILMNYFDIEANICSNIKFHNDIEVGNINITQSFKSSIYLKISMTTISGDIHFFSINVNINIYISIDTNITVINNVIDFKIIVCIYTVL